VFALQAAAVIRQHPTAITSGKAICKGKGKIDGIGAKVGEVIDELLETGEVAKIAEKRAEMASR
jgi:DNA polymerase/3'-5' exonuclease PolX